MLRRLLTHPAAIASIDALFVGLVGGAYASKSGLIGSRQIKDYSIRLVDLSLGVHKLGRRLGGRCGARLLMAR
jgi:hypothetical protein